MVVLALAFSLTVAVSGGAPDEGAPRYAIRCGKVLTMNDEDQVLTPGMIWVEDGRITYVGRPKEAPEGFELLDFPDSWATPGMIDLHTHIHTGGWGDINDMVLPINADLRSLPAYRPGNFFIQRACASGVTTLFGIPGSGTSISGFGILYKAKPNEGFASSTFAAVGGMKVAQTHNPERGLDLGATRCGLSWILEDANDKARAAVAQDRFDLPMEALKKVHSGELPVLIHCAGSEGVAGAARMWKGKYGTRSVISHGSFDGWYTAHFVASLGMPVNHGPRTFNWRYGMVEERIVGSAAEYVKAGVPNFSLNTDSGVIPQEELFLQGAVSSRLGADAYQMLRALTIHPARSFGIDDRLGSLEVGKDADIVLKNGDPLDPRTRVELVLIDGEVQYSPEHNGQWF